MNNVNYKTKSARVPSLKTRITIAANCLKSGEGVNSRGFDACFEQGVETFHSFKPLRGKECFIGDDVVTALVYQCEWDAELYQGIVQCFGGVFPKTWTETAIKA